MQGRSKRAMSCPGPQPEDLSPRGRQREHCGRDKDDERWGNRSVGWMCEWDGRKQIGIDFVCESAYCVCV